MAQHKHRHIGAQLQTQLRQFRTRKSRAPDAVQGCKGGGGVGTPPAKPTALGQYFVDADIGALAHTGVTLQQLRGTDGEIVLFGNALNCIYAANASVIPRCELQGVA